MKTLRFSTPTSDGELVLVQFVSDPELAYISREQLGAPSLPAIIDVQTNGFTAILSNSCSARAEGQFEFFTCFTWACDESPDDGSRMRNKLIFPYTMTTPGNGSADGSDPGTWSTPMDDKLISCNEVIEDVVAMSSIRADFALRSANRIDVPCSYLVCQSLAKLKLEFVSAKQFNAKIAISLDAPLNA